MLVVGRVRLPYPCQPVSAVVVIALHVHQRPGRDRAACKGRVVLLHPGQLALAVVEVLKLHAARAVRGPPGRQIVELAVAIGPACPVAVVLPRQRPGPRVVAVLHQSIGAAHLDLGKQTRRGILQRVVRGSIRRVGVAQPHQQIVAVAVGDGAVPRLAGDRTPHRVIAVAPCCRRCPSRWRSCSRPQYRSCCCSGSFPRCP